MTLEERKQIIINVIRTLEDKIVALAHCEYDGHKCFLEREAEKEVLQGHLRSAHSCLVYINEEELRKVS